MSPTEPVPTPNQWLDKKLRELQLSRAGVARLIGRSREEVQRWVNGREQIPRHHLAEVAAQLGTSSDLEYVLKLKECEDIIDTLKRRIRDLARIGRCEPKKLESAIFDLLHRKTDEARSANLSEHASVYLYNAIHAAFVMRLWCDSARNNDFAEVLNSQNVHFHLRYPSNNFFGLVLDLEGEQFGQLSAFREASLVHLRSLAKSKPTGGPYELSRHHAIHMLARHGSAEDQAVVSELIRDAASSHGPLCRRLGYSGLILRSGTEGLVDEYIYLLQSDDHLAIVDLIFEAVHYGDIKLSSNGSLPARTE